MKLRRVYRFVLLAAAGGIVCQATTSCSTQLAQALASTVAQTISSIITSGISSYINKALGLTA